MAKNISTASTEYVDTESSQVYEGTFIGDLQGNAQTATALKENMTITFAGDVEGTLITNGANSQARLQVNQAQHANSSDHASTADSVAHADTAGTATYSTRAGTADTASRATLSDQSKSSDYASQAGVSKRAELADNATNATNAKYADSAKYADNATNATTAQFAKELDPTFIIDSAKYAEKANLAVRAQYDCRGYSIKDMYALKSEIINKDEAFTLEDAQELFIGKNEKLLQATVTGKAHGRGIVSNQTLNILIDSITSEDNSFYDVLKFITTDTVPDDSDTTKVYVTNQGNLHVYDIDKQGWVTITAQLDSNLQQNIDLALERLQNVVTVDGDQTIKGNKKFENILETEIPSLEEDSDRTVAVLHNLRDLKDELVKDLGGNNDQIIERINTLESLINAQAKGDLLFAYVDYSIVSNQVNMVVGTRYLTLLTEQKEYIAIDPLTNEPVNPEQVAFWYRYYMKNSEDRVVYQDYRINVDLSEYANLKTENTFTKRTYIPSTDLTQEPQRTSIESCIDNTVQNADNEISTDYDLGLSLRTKSDENKPLGYVGAQLKQDKTRLAKLSVFNKAGDEISIGVNVDTTNTYAFAPDTKGVNDNEIVVKKYLDSRLSSLQGDNDTKLNDKIKIVNTEPEELVANTLYLVCGNE